MHLNLQQVVLRALFVGLVVMLTQLKHLYGAHGLRLVYKKRGPVPQAVCWCAPADPLSYSGPPCPAVPRCLLPL